MGWSQTSRILLVWPKQRNILNRRLDLVYLKRHSNVLGAQLALVTKDSNIRFYARKFNIPVYPTIRKAEESHWRRPRRQKSKTADSYSFSTTRLFSQSEQNDEPDLEELRKSARPRSQPWLSHPVTRLLFFTLGVLGVLSIAAILVPSSEIRLSPQTRWEEVTIPASASLQTESSDLSGTVPAQIISVIIEGRGNIPTTGSVTIPDQKSQGKVVFSNFTDESITVPTGIIVSTQGDDPVRFTTLETIELSPNFTSELVPVEAVNPGSRGNVLSNHIIVIEGPLGLDLTVTNPIGTSHGTDQTSSAPSENDYHNLLEELLADLYITAISELEAKLDSDDLLIWTDPTDFEVLETIYDPIEIQPADILFMTLRVEYNAYVVPGIILADLGKSILKANIQADYSPIEPTFKIKHIQSPTPDDEMIFSWDMTAGWQVSAVVDEIEVAKTILWFKPEDATRQLTNKFPINDDIVISMTPSWWPRLPILPFRVDVINITESLDNPGW